MTSQTRTYSQQSPFSQHFQHTLSKSTPLPQISFGGVYLPEKLIYLDHAAATPMDERVLAKMLPWLTHVYGNPANRLHAMGELAEHGLAYARRTLAEAIECDFEEITFCSSATEANNLLLRGLVQHPLRKRNKIVVASTEHSSVMTTASELAGNDVTVEVLPVDHDGQIALESAQRIIDEKTLCVCVMDVNNETGIVQRHLPDVALLARSKGALLHVDAVQGFARGEFQPHAYQYDSLTLSGAKIYAGRGAAALVIRKRTPRIRVSPQLTGGGHENGLRSGTPNLAAIVGFAEAARLQVEERRERHHYLSHLESILLSNLQGRIAFSSVGRREHKAPGLMMIHIPRVNSMKLIENMRSICVSAGSACKTLQATTSHVLMAMGFEEDVSLSSFRISLGITNTEAEMHESAKIIAEAGIALQKTSANSPS